MPEKPQSDPMAHEVDRLLAKLESSGPRGATTETMASDDASSVIPLRPKLAPVVSSADGPAVVPPLALWGRTTLALLLGAGMLLWPYPHGCGWPLCGYVAAVGVVLLSGGWVALTAWKSRNGVVHILALVLFFWGIVLAAEQILPRIGYAAVHATWLCHI